MEKNHRFTLVQGKFDSDDAGTVLRSLINSKINFHNMERFGRRERGEAENPHHEKRVGELKSAGCYVDEIIQYATANNKRLKLEGDIRITIVK